MTDPELSVAYKRAYNRWIADFCRAAGGRLVPIAHLTLLDPEAAAAELERAVADGCRGGCVAPFTHTRKPHGHPDHDVLFAKACELDVPLAIHPTYEPAWAMPVRFKGLGRAAEFFYNVMLRQGVQQAFLSFFALGTLERFPALRLGVLEAGSGWIGAFLDRMDAVYDTISANGVALSDEAVRVLPPPVLHLGRSRTRPRRRSSIEHVGADCFMWATDYPHPDHPGTWVRALERFVAPLDAGSAGQGARRERARIYGL